MDNTKIFIDIDDEITFIAERVLSAPTQNVILVVPEKASILSSLASLKLLNFVVAKSGKKIVLVTMDEVGKILAGKAGFETRNRVGEVESDIWARLIVDAPEVSPLTSTTTTVLSTEKVEETIEEVVEEVAKELEMTTVSEAAVVETATTEEPLVEVPGIASLPEPIEEDMELPVPLDESPQGVMAAIETEEEMPAKEESKTEIVSAVREEPKEESVVDREISLSEMKNLNPSIYDIDSGLPQPEERVEEKERVVESVPAAPPSQPKPKYVDSVRIVKLDGFDLVVGGDAAVIKKSREIERKVVEKKANTIASFHHSAQQAQTDGIIGHDTEANVSKKKDNLTKKAYMQTLGKVTMVGGKHFRTWMLIPTGIVLLVLLAASFIFLPTADIAVNVNSKPVTATNDVVANINNPKVDTNALTIPAYLVDVNESSSSSLNTTGTKMVGNKATGPVLIYNNTTNDVTIPAGAVLITNDNNAFKYTTNADVTIKGTTGQPSSQSVNVTAADIGAQYNINANVPFTRSGTPFPSGVTAVSNAAFQGGTSTQAQVVAQADQDHLLGSLTQQLTTKATADLSAKITDDMIVIKDSQKIDQISKSFDSNVGDKADILNLSLTIKDSEIVYHKSDIDSFARGILLTQATNHETIKDVTDTVTYKGFDSATGNVRLSIVSNASLTPTLNKDDIAKASVAKSQNSVNSYIMSLEGVKHTQIKISPFWYGWLHLLPTRVSNIHVTIQAE